MQPFLAMITPVDSGAHPEHPIVVPPPAPAHPIVIPPDSIGPGVPSHPIVLPTPPLGIWGGAPIPVPTPPIYLPPDTTIPPPDPNKMYVILAVPGIGYKIVQVPIPPGYNPPPGGSVPTPQRK